MAPRLLADEGRVKRGGRRALSALLLCLNALAVLSEENNTSFLKTGPQPCSSDSSKMGYDNTTALTIDMMIDYESNVAAILADNPNPSLMDYRDWHEGKEWVYKLCPQTTIDLGGPGEQTEMPIVPIVMNSVIQCGDNGSSDDGCVISGGKLQVVFEDDFQFHSVKLAGITFKANNFISVAAYAHPMNDATFVDCVWTENNYVPILIDLAYDPNMNFFIEPGNRGRRTEESFAVSKIGAGNMRSAFDVDENTISKILDRAKKVESSRGLQQESPPGYNGMLAVFQNCKFLGNVYQLYGIFNSGGSLDFDGTTFVQNAGFAIIVVVDEGQILLHGGTEFKNNRDVYGPVFLDDDSVLAQNQNVGGEGNMAIDVNGMPVDDSCSGIFKENREGSRCLMDGGVCVGRCCDFGMPICFTEPEPEGYSEEDSEEGDSQEGVSEEGDSQEGVSEEGDSEKGGSQERGSEVGDTNEGDGSKTEQAGATPGKGVAMPANAGTRAAEGGGGGGCDTTCIVIATVVPVCTIALILLVVWFVRRSPNEEAKQNSTEPSYVSEPSAASTPPPPTMDQVEAEVVEPTFDHEHQIA
mmetsp:Transcript_63099/g.186437  ORF Transcript_63099/g.186437 Transcript_63099/m.186437 type:complete len:582 (-) Transcript_63099:130-1875(-)